MARPNGWVEIVYTSGYLEFLNDKAKEKWPGHKGFRVSASNRYVCFKGTKRAEHIGPLTWGWSDIHGFDSGYDTPEECVSVIEDVVLGIFYICRSEIRRITGARRLKGDDWMFFECVIKGLVRELGSKTAAMNWFRGVS